MGDPRSIKYAYIMSTRLGDTLIAMVVVNNLMRNGHDVTVFSDLGYGLRAWFPSIRIEPASATLNFGLSCSSFDLILHTYPTDVPSGLLGDKRVVIFDQLKIFRQRKNMVDIQIDLCRSYFHLSGLTKDNGLIPPGGVTRKPKGGKRVLIHPIASSPEKTWSAHKFLALARWLDSNGYEVEFALPASARDLSDTFYSMRRTVVSFHTDIASVAMRIMKCDYVIGNDSGLGHLASALRKPTVAIAIRPGIAKRWKPGWDDCVTVAPTPFIPGRYLKERYWDNFVTVSMVTRAFQELRDIVHESAVRNALN